MFENWTGQALWIAMLATGIVIIVTSLLFLVWKIRTWKKYKDYIAMIFNEDEYGQKDIVFDKAGIFTEGKTNQKKFFLQRANVGLDVDQLAYSHCDGKKLVMLEKRHKCDYKYVKPVFRKMEGVDFSMTEEDLNWGLNAFERAKNTYEWKSKFLQYAPYLGLFFIGFVFLILCIYMMKQWDILPQVSANIKEATANLAQARAGTAVIQ